MLRIAFQKEVKVSAVEVVNRRALAKVLAMAFLAAGLLAGAVGTAEAKGMDDRVPEVSEIKHGVEVENEVEIEHRIEIEVETLG